jgi:two-component system OmpR family sensor kinase
MGARRCGWACQLVLPLVWVIVKSGERSETLGPFWATAIGARAIGSAHRAELQSRRFLSDASHELRTPLAGIQVVADQLIADAGVQPGTPDKTDGRETRAGRHAALLASETRKTARLVNDLLEIARIDAGGLSCRPERTDLGPIVAAEVDRTAMLAPRLNVQTIDGTAQVMVTDTGPGVPDDDLERIFDRLVRLEDSRDRDSGGSGLGLSIARALAEAHHGTLVCLPSDSGAKFRLALPISPPPNPAA